MAGTHRLTGMHMGWLRRAMRPVIFAGLTILAAPLSAWAVKADPKPHVRYQPDGSPIVVRMIGDERMCFFESEAGYTLVRDPGGYWVYADPSTAQGESLAPSCLRAGRDTVPEGWPRHLRPRIDYASLEIPMRPVNDGSVKRRFLECGFGTRADQSLQKDGRESLAVDPTPLSLPVLVILVDFADAASRHTTRAGDAHFR